METSSRIWCIFALLLLSSAVARRIPPGGKFALGDDPWRPLNWTELPMANPDDKVDVYYLVAPLLQEDLGPVLGELNLFHGALGFVNTRTKFTITINYNADDFLHSSLFPIIRKDKNETTLEWANGGAAFIYEGIYEPYWCTLNEKVAETSGKVYNQLIAEWNAQINTTKPHYNMFSISPSFSEAPWIPSWECFDFVWEAFDFLARRGATFFYSSANRDFTNVYASKAPVRVTDLYNNDPLFKRKVDQFYEVIQLKLGDLTFWELLVTIFEMFRGEFFLRQSEDYYQIRLRWPFAGLDWQPGSLPNATAPPLNTPKNRC